MTILTALVLLAFSAVYAEDACTLIKTAKDKNLADKITGSYHLYDCTDETIAANLSRGSCARLAARLRNQICRLAIKGLPEKQIRDALDRRGQTMVTFEKPAEIDLSGAPGAGNDSGRVVMVAFICARCPFCRLIIPPLYRAIEKGPLQSKARLYVRLFPIKGHPGSVEGGLALEAASRMGGFWEYLAVVYGKFDSFSVNLLGPWADSAGLKRPAFDSLRADASVYQSVSDSKKEGIRLGVSETPTFYINGRKYVADADLETMTDIIEEEYETIKKGK